MLNAMQKGKGIPLHTLLKAIERDIKNKKNISPTFTTAKEAIHYLDKAR